MALEDKDEHKGSDDDPEVSVTEEEILEILKDSRKELKRYARVTRKLSVAYDKVCAELVIVNGKIKSQSAPTPESLEPDECQSCLVVMADLAELRHRYTQRVEERDACKANLEATKKELLAAQAPIVSEVEPCETCPTLESELEKLRKQCEAQVRDLEKFEADVEELRARPALLGA